MKDKNKNRTVSDISALFADTRQIMESGGFSTAGAASVAKILNTGLRALDLAALEITAPDHQRPDPCPEKDTWINQAVSFAFTPQSPPNGFGWQRGKSGAYWMLRNASLILSGWIKPGSRVTLTGNHQGLRNGADTLNVQAGAVVLTPASPEKKVTGPRLAIGSGNRKSWSKRFVMPDYKTPSLPYSILYLSARGRVLVPDLRRLSSDDISEDTDSGLQGEGSLSFTGISIEP